MTQVVARWVDCYDCQGKECLDDWTGACKLHEIWVMCLDCLCLYPVIDGATSKGVEPSLESVIVSAFRCPSCESGREPWSSFELERFGIPEKPVPRQRAYILAA